MVAGDAFTAGINAAAAGRRQNVMSNQICRKLCKGWQTSSVVCLVELASLAQSLMQHAGLMVEMIVATNSDLCKVQKGLVLLHTSAAWSVDMAKRKHSKLTDPNEQLNKFQ